MEATERPVPIPTSPPPGGAHPVPYKEPQDGVSAEALRKLAHYYLNTDAKVDDIAVDLGLTTRDVRGAIKRYGLDKQKHEIITQVQQEELAAYSKVLLDNRVTTAEQHLRISNQLNSAVEKVLSAAEGKTVDEIQEMIKPLKNLASLYRSLSETFSASSGVGARAVSLSGLTAEQAGGLVLAGAKGKQPLVSMSFQVSQSPSAQAPQQPEPIEAEFTEETR